MLLVIFSTGKQSTQVMKKRKHLNVSFVEQVLKRKTSAQKILRKKNHYVSNQKSQAWKLTELLTFIVPNQFNIQGHGKWGGGARGENAPLVFWGKRHKIPLKFCLLCMVLKYSAKPEFRGLQCPCHLSLCSKTLTGRGHI